MNYPGRYTRSIAALAPTYPALDGKGDWVLPIPATLVIAQDGRIITARLDVDYPMRVAPQEVLESLEQMTNT
ncbi:MAG: hypothetical protein ACLPXB_05930 [Thiobacillaceae bacterium]